MKRTALLMLLLTAAAVAPAFAEPAPADAAWEKFTAARRVYHIRLCDMANRRWPEFSGFFTTHRDLQLAFIERRNLVFYHLQANAPERIVRNKGGEVFLNFSWTDDEQKQFAKTIPGFDDLSKEIERLKKQADGFQRQSALRDRFERLEIDPEYLALMRETTRSIVDAERTLHTRG